MMKRADIKAIILFFLINLFNVIEAAGWKESKSFILQKDEQVKVLVKSEGQERLLNFRWTLYTDKGLIVHENFDRFVGQHVLYTGHNQSFRKLLLNEKRTNRDVPYILVVFKKFDEGNKTAHMDLLLFDKESRVTLDYLTNK
jgi:hypothetical protein